MSAERRTVPAAPRRDGDAIVRAALRFREAGIVVFLVAVVVVFSVAQPRFLNLQNAQSIVSDLAILLVVAAGQTLIIVTRNIDLSVGSVVGVSVMATATYLADHPGLPLPLVFAMGIAIGAILGAINGAAVALFAVPSIVTTLGTLGLYRGVAYWVSNGSQVDPHQLPSGLLSLSSTTLFVPWLVYIAVAVALLMAFALRFTRVGRHCYLVGDNPEGAVLRGIAVGRVTLLAFTLSGALAGLAGILYIAQFGTANPADAGVGLELRSVAAVVIGGASLFGGSGRMAGTALGSLLLAVVINGLYVANVSAYWEEAFIGAAILVAVLADGILRRRAMELAIQARRRV
jgi:rhamnose transport system permease protein